MALNRKRLVYFEQFFHPIAVELLSAQEDIELVRLQYATPEADTWTEMSRAVGYQCNAGTEIREPWYGNAALFARCPNMLMCSSIGAGYDVINVDDANKAGIVVVNQSGTNSEPVAEHAIGMVLALSKKISISNRAMKRETVERSDYAGNDIQGKTVGIVGLGHIGGRSAKFYNAFDMEVIAYDPYLTKEQIEAKGAKKVEFAELLKRSDFVSVHTPRNKGTIGMFGAAEFAQMKPSAYFINTARYGIHKEPDLVAALEKKVIAGAGIDVFDEEPTPPTHPLLKFENVICTPHIAGMTVETTFNMSRKTAEQWITLMRGEVPPRLVNPEVWPLYSDRFEQIIGFRPKPLS